MTESVAFANIDPALYRHPGEEQSLAYLKKIPGFEKTLTAMAGMFGGKAERNIEVGSMVRVSPGVYPDLDELWYEVKTGIAIPDVSLHIAMRPRETTAIRGGNAHPRVILAAELLDSLTRDEMHALLATLAASIRLGHADLLSAADLLRRISDFSGVVAAPTLMLSWGIENWRRCSAFSSDRAAALYLREPRKLYTLLERMAGANRRAWGGIVDYEKLRLQGLEAMSLDKDWDNSRWTRFVTVMNRHNNGSLIRLIDLQDWFTSGIPDRILAGEKFEQARKDDDSSDSADPGLAFWGEFACGMDDDPDKQNPLTDLFGKAEKGVGAFKKAGEAFWKTLTDNI